MSFGAQHTHTNHANKECIASGTSLSSTELMFIANIRESCRFAGTYNMLEPEFKDPWGMAKLCALLELLPEGVFLAGGAVASCVYGALGDAGDIDLFFDSFITMNATISDLVNAGYYHENMDDLADLKQNPHTINYINMLPKNSLTALVPKRVQLVKRSWYRSAADVIDDFDLIHCKMALTKRAGEIEVYTHPLAFSTNNTKTLLGSCVYYVDSFVKRCERYKQRGFKTWEGAAAAVTQAKIKTFTASLPSGLNTQVVYNLSTPVVAPQPPYDKYSDPQYISDYNMMDPVEFNRKWSGK